MSVNCASKACTFVPITKPKDVLAAEAEVAPVPPSAIAKVPVIELASSFNASYVDSITKPPFDFKSKLNSLPLLSNPSPAVVVPDDEKVL